MKALTWPHKEISPTISVREKSRELCDIKRLWEPVFTDSQSSTFQGIALRNLSGCRHNLACHCVAAMCDDHVVSHS
jgi:hypothetical protein